jgi:chondroitin AC lyase
MKMKLRISLQMIVLLGSLIFPFVSIFAQEGDISLLRQRLLQDALIQQGFVPRVSQYMAPAFDQGQTYLKALSEDGSWSDVDYSDRDNEWEPLIALNRILVMSYDHANPDSDTNPEILKGIENALSYWYKVNPECDNWYKNRIAKQMYLGVIGILVGENLREELRFLIIQDLTDKPSMTGSNRTLLATSVFYRGVLERDPERIKMGVEGVTDQIAITDGEGVQVDFSFHQHGPYLYNGSYGSNFLRESIWMAAMVQGTAFAFSEDHLGLLRNYFWEGTRWMLRKGVLDYNVRGRQVGRPSGFDQRADILIPQLSYFMMADPMHREIYKDAQERIVNRRPQDLSGNLHFWRSDYTVHHRNSHFTSLRMCSERTIGVETDVNSENLKGYYLPYGLTYIYRRGDEYENIFPVWDWTRLPGVTNPQELPIGKGNFTQDVAFVGGVSDGRFGVSAMELDVRTTRAKKSWFWFEDEWVALGAGISSENENNITTGVNQCRLIGPVYVGKDKEFSGDTLLINPEWVWHDSIGYLFHQNYPIELQLEAGEKTGNLHSIFGLGADTVFSMASFSLWYEHGQKPKEEYYAYTVLPGKSLIETNAYREDQPIVIKENTSEVQAVFHKKMQLSGMVFYRPGTVQLIDEFAVSVDSPCLLLLDHKNGDIWVSDPSTKSTNLKITLRKGGKVDILPVQLPQGVEAGKSVQVSQ